jgi:hypothetical protein
MTARRLSYVENRKRTIYIDHEIDKQMRVAAVEDDKFYGEYAEEAFRSFLDQRRKERNINEVPIIGGNMWGGR